MAFFPLTAAMASQAENARRAIEPFTTAICKLRWRRAAVTSPGTHIVRKRLASAQRSVGLGGFDRARALKALEQAERDNPADAEVIVYLAGLYRKLEQPEKAIPLYRRAMELDPAQVTAPVGLGGILMERGQYAEAIRLWQDALAKNAGLELVRTNMALAQGRNGDLQAAERSLATAAELSPGFAAPAELLQKLREQMRQKP
jgi:peptidoglycan-associated lipoprotein